MSRTSSRELEPLVHQFQHLSDKRRAPEALERLKKIASLVKPIMRQRNWTVGTLAEFYPSEANLLGLNVNRGEKICLRLRYPGDETQFLPMENVVDTMLHELSHIVYGPHNQDFHALWDKLRDEHEALIRKGYTGEGFQGQGRRLGGAHIPLSELRRQARAAAERRRALTAGSGQKLGGSGILRGQNPRDIIAAAAEKRLKIERGCASDTDRGRRIAREEEVKNDKVTTTTVEQETEYDAAIMQAYIDMIREEEQEQFGDDYIPPSQNNPAGVRGLSSPPGLRTTMVPTLSPISLLEQQRQIEQNLQHNRQIPPDIPLHTKPGSVTAQPAEPKSTATEQAETWTCEICTLLNPMQFLACGACGTERPALYPFSDTDTPEDSQPLHSLPKSTASSRGNKSNGISKNRNQRDTPNALKPRLNVADSLAKLEAQAEYKKQQPVGWKCSCGNWMEQEWWTCSLCGRIKESS